MPAPSPLAPFLEPLERLGLPYCVAGSVAASVLAATKLNLTFVESEVARLGLLAQWRQCKPDGDKQ